MPVNDMLHFFASFIETELGIIYSESNYFQLQNRLEDIARLTGHGTIERLFEQAKAGIAGSFRQLLLDVATNNETSFFRDPRVFRALESTVLKNLIAEKKGQPIRIWSAASSAGQEVLSVAILLQEHATKMNTPIQFSITGTDISERVLEKAQSGVYTQLEIQRGLSAQHMIKYFKKDAGDKWIATPELMKHISYRKLNLKEAFPFFQKFDIILCRNVLIYQNVPGKIGILSRITQTLEPGGLLILGSGESLVGISNEYKQVDVDGAIFYRKADSTLAKAA